MGSFQPDGVGGLVWIDRTASIDFAPAEDGLDPAYNPYPYRTHGMAFFDYDGDADVDLYVGNGGPMPDGEVMAEANRLFRNDGPATLNQVRVELVGVTSPRDGTGAMVVVSNGPPGTEDWQVVRQASPTSGFNSAQPRILRVGTGSCPGPYHVRITWPSGLVQDVGGVAAGSLLTVLEGGP